MMKSSAELVIERPARYAKQLASHIGTRAEVTNENGMSTIRFGFGGVGTIATSETSVLLTAEAEDQERLSRIQDVLGSHLLRFSKAAEGTALAWS